MDSIFSIQDHFPVYSVFLLILIISASSLESLFPCRLKYAIYNNIYIKHLFAFMTMVFFVVLTIPISDKKIYDIIPKTFLLYAFFLFLIKTEFHFFIIILIIISIIYILVLRKTEIKDDIEREKIKSSQSDSIESSEKVAEYNTIVTVNNTLFISIVPMLLIGNLIYLGRKKQQYKDKFSILKFIFGNFKCNHQPHNIPIRKSLEYFFK